MYIKPTYEEYCKASAFAKTRYKIGVYVQIVAVILLLFLIFYTIINVEEMKSNPVDYAEKKLGAICFSPTNIQTEYNGSTRNITNTEKGE